MYELEDDLNVLPGNYKYNEEHLWMEFFEPGLVRCGITEYLTVETGNIVFLEYIRNILNMKVYSGERILFFESLRNSIIIKAPFDGVIMEINNNCIESPEIINSDPYGEGWLFIISIDDYYEYERQLDSDEYYSITIITKESEER